MNDELPRYRWNKKCATKNKIVTKQKKPKKSPQKTQNPQKKSNSKNKSKKQNNRIEMLTKPTKKEQVFPKHTTNLETLKLSLTKKISSIQNYTKP
jgi:hypothetical protein